jgi:hypothetical protein
MSTLHATSACSTQNIDSEQMRIFVHHRKGSKDRYTLHTAVLHNWGQNLCFHPNIHSIVPSGGLTALGKTKVIKEKVFSDGTSIENGAVTFKWLDYRDNSHWKITVLAANEFIRRFLMHILPAGFTKIRHYGFLLSRGKQKKLKICKIETWTNLFPMDKFSAKQLIQKLIGRKPTQCPRCEYSGLLRTGFVPPAA